MPTLINKATLRGPELTNLETMARAMRAKGWNNEPWQWLQRSDGSVEVTWESTM